MSYNLNSDLTDSFKYKITNASEQTLTWNNTSSTSNTLMLSGSDITYTPDAGASFVSYNYQLSTGCFGTHASYRRRDNNIWLEMDDGQENYSFVSGTHILLYSKPSWHADVFNFNFLLKPWSGSKSLKLMCSMNKHKDSGSNYHNKSILHRHKLWVNSDSDTSHYCHPTLNVYSVF